MNTPLGIIIVLAPFLGSLSVDAQYQKFGSKGRCPELSQRSPYECEGQVANCWSPGVPDLDCPGNGLCCDNGCVAKCLDYDPAPLRKPASYPKPLKKHHVPAKQYPKPAPQHKEALHHFPKRTAQKVYPLHPHLARGSPEQNTNCPAVTRKAQHECHGRTTHRCWSPGHPDTDCTGNGFCCFDGCANTCLRDNYQPPPPVRTTKRPSNPCHPSPCGPGTTCTVNGNGDPVCQCVGNLVPKPDTITGCGPECVIDPDCGYGLVCRSQQCVLKPDPCSPSPCGPGTTCRNDGNGNAICECQLGLIPKPDTITGCGPECDTDYDCSRGYICQSHKCVPKPDPCNPSPCGPRTTCTANHLGNPVCNCQPGFVPKPDTITGCGYECTKDAECYHKPGTVCMDYKCVPRADPCYPSPCGPGAYCLEGPKGNAICECEQGLIPKPDTVTGCGPQCVIDDDCPIGYVCQYNKCIERPDPCDPSPCGQGTSCEVDRNSNAICKCLPGLVPMADTIEGCGPECTVDPDCYHTFGSDYVCENQRCVEKADPCNPTPCGPGTSCEPNSRGFPICKCLGRLIPQPDTITGCGPECVVDPDCPAGYRCEYEQCVEKPDPCNPNPCGMMAICTPKGYDDYHCECPRGRFGDGFISCQQGECLKDADCPNDKACMDYFCISPCLMNSTCSAQDFCKVINHISVCGSNQGPPPEGRTPVVIGGRYNPVQPRPESRTNIVIGGQYSGSQRGSSSNCVGRRCGFSEGPRPSIVEARRRSHAGRPRVIGAQFNKK
ncbi:hypothetical protein TCAL_10964 [Tigriopus californicus]|uniref:EGF-like domain-containing protein n=1 Tax=Tigriopus californicus TaxID=6832 RepID=A0A553PS95_TIGCA|nr:neurogenic locus notch homolog protein 3-like [Tigriopus californicus]TRY80549.1 hypothetical protein TCAL_10964 [Tigriopus californicus]|eukprot:TCALIF_10964-PA protein Name:"Similar to ft Cadherin-related tumor suppressor (Drosophila melanogaster)" AED:0.03 eAED:0.03 QI:127/1/1/1/0.83/0.85/7/89/774